MGARPQELDVYPQQKTPAEGTVHEKGALDFGGLDYSRVVYSFLKFFLNKKLID